MGVFRALRPVSEQGFGCRHAGQEVQWGLERKPSPRHLSVPWVHCNLQVVTVESPLLDILDLKLQTHELCGFELRLPPIEASETSARVSTKVIPSSIKTSEMTLNPEPGLTTPQKLCRRPISRVGPILSRCQHRERCLKTDCSRMQASWRRLYRL